MTVAIVEEDQKEGILRSCRKSKCVVKIASFICLHDIFLCIAKGGDSGKALKHLLSISLTCRMGRCQTVLKQSVGSVRTAMWRPVTAPLEDTSSDLPVCFP